MSLEEEYEYYSDDARDDFELSENEIMSCESDGDDFGELQTLDEIGESNPHAAKRKEKLLEQISRKRGFIWND